MVSPFSLPPEFLRDRGSNGVKSFDLKHSTVTSSTFPSLPTFANDYSFWPTSTDIVRNPKRQKQEARGDEPTSSGGNLCDGDSKMRKNSRQSLPRLRFRDHVWAYSQRYFAIEAMEEATTAMTGGEQHQEEEEEEGSGYEMKLVQQLNACAEAVACRDKAHASVLLCELKANALVFGTSFQRVASCFVQGLSDRLSMIQPLGAVGVLGSTPKPMAATLEKEEALHLAYEICPQIQFAHFVANSLILEAFEGESTVHVVDLGMSLGLPHGHQWRMLMQSLANHRGQPVSRLRVTGVGSCGERLQAIGYELELCAKDMGLNFEFLCVESNLENLKPECFKIHDGEILIINSILQLHCAVKESRGALNSVLKMLHALSPKLFILVEQDSSHNGPFFLGRFMEALHYYSAIFDSLEAMLPRYDTRRAKMEQFFFAEEVKNIISCEGPARVERHERIDQWRRRMSRAGFQATPLKKITQAEEWLIKASICEGYTVMEEKGCMVLGWKSKPIIAKSCWKCSSL